MTNELNATIAVRYNITVKQNQTFNPLFKFVDEDGDPVNLSGSTAKLSVRQKEGCNSSCDDNFDSSFNLLYHQDFLPTVTGVDNNELQFNEVINLTPGMYAYDLLVEFQSGEQQYYLTGSFNVKKSYTKI